MAFNLHLSGHNVGILMCGDYAFTGHEFVKTALHPKSIPIY